MLGFVTGPRRIAKELMQMSTADINKSDALRFLAPYSAQGENTLIQATAVYLGKHQFVCGVRDHMLPHAMSRRRHTEGLPLRANSFELESHSVQGETRALAVDTRCTLCC